MTISKKDNNFSPLVVFDIFYNRDNDLPCAIRIVGKRKWLLADAVSLSKVNLVSMTNKRTEPKFFYRGMGRIYKDSKFGSKKISYLIIGV